MPGHRFKEEVVLVYSIKKDQQIGRYRFFIKVLFIKKFHIKILVVQKILMDSDSPFWKSP